MIGVLREGQALAVPHNILWFHEIVNFDRDGRSFAVTYCPLTGSSLAFDRAAVGGAELRVSGLLFDNNLVMYDRRENRSLWPQMNRQANCGANVGTRLSMVPVVEMRWARWKALHSDTKVVSSRTPYARDYREGNYPYDDYEQRDNDRVLFDMPIDERRPRKNAFLGFRMGRLGALPFRLGHLTRHRLGSYPWPLGERNGRCFGAARHEGHGVQNVGRILGRERNHR